jgi:lipid-binding SYLF domain-containing protein
MDFSDLTYYSNLTSNYIRYLHGDGEIICAVTNSGVDVVKINPQSYRSYTVISGAKKCFMTSTGKLYYTISGSSNWSLNVRNNPLTDWSEPDYSYITGSGIFSAGIKLNDIYITENTGSDGFNNTVFCATTSGVFVIDETDDTYSVYYKE